jgi:hypothetical protein
MSRDKLEGFLIGLAAGVLLGAFIEVRQEDGKHVPTVDTADWELDGVSVLRAAAGAEPTRH